MFGSPKFIVGPSDTIPRYVNDWLHFFSSVRVAGPLPMTFYVYRLGPETYKVKIITGVALMFSGDSGELQCWHELLPATEKERLRYLRSWVHLIYLHEADEQICLANSFSRTALPWQPFNPHFPDYATNGALEITYPYKD